MDLVIQLGPRRAKILGDLDRGLVDFLDDATSAYVKNYQFSKLFRQKRKDGSRVWDGKKHLFSRTSNTFSVGVLDIVCDVLNRMKVKYSLDNAFLKEMCLPPHVEANWSGGWMIPDQAGPYTLYEYQKDSIREFLNPARTLPYRGLIKIGTGGGKTAIGATIAKILGAKTIFLVHGKKLTRQNLDVFYRVFEGQEDLVGSITSDDWSPSLVTVASSDTLYSRMKNVDYEDKVNELIDGTVLTIADECHRATSTTFEKVINLINSPMRLGLSGTPNKQEDDRDLLLHSLTGPILYEMGVDQLKKEGTISKAHLLGVTVSSPKIDSLDWVEAFSTLIVNNGYRHRVIAELIKERHRSGKTILVLAGNSIALADNIYQAVVGTLKDKVHLVNGVSKDEDVDNAFSLLQKKEISCVITTTIADEGIDIPAVNSLILAGGGKSYVRTIQRVGRTLRLKEDGSAAEIVDILDKTNRYLKAHAKARLEHYEAEKLFDTCMVIKASTIIGDNV